MTATTFVLFLALAWLGYLLAKVWTSSEGYRQAVHARSRARELKLERLKAENEIAIDTARWQAEIARADFDRTRARMHAEADADPDSPLRRIM